jgi:LmbE family N-acetylglucosaminyl deacetylase
MKRILWAALLILFIFSFARAAEISKMPAIAPADRILILAPHPDDETIACAGIIQAAIDAGAQVRVVYLTNGEHNQFAFIVYEKRIPFRKNEFIHLGQVRRKEAVAAMRLLGLSQERLIFLGYPDFGTFSIFSRHWGGCRAIPGFADAHLGSPL